MKSILKEIYYGRLNEADRPICEFFKTKEYEEMNKHFDKFADTLTKEQFKLFDLYDEKNTLFNDLIFERTYKNGIKTGMLLILELLNFEPTYKD